MKQKDLLIISIGIFLTIVAWVIIEIKGISSGDVSAASEEGPRVEKHTIDTTVIDILREKNP